MAEPVGPRRAASAAFGSPDIRFSDVAHFVNLSLTHGGRRDPRSSPPPRRGGGTASNGQQLPSAAAGAGSSAGSRPARSPQASPGLVPGLVPSLWDAAPPRSCMQNEDKLRLELEWLRAEQRAEQDKLKRLDRSFSDAVLQEKKAHSRLLKSKELRQVHLQKSEEFEAKIAQVRKEISRTEHDHLASGTTASSSQEQRLGSSTSAAAAALAPRSLVEDFGAAAEPNARASTSASSDLGPRQSGRRSSELAAAVAASSAAVAAAAAAANPQPITLQDYWDASDKVAAEVAVAAWTRPVRTPLLPLTAATPSSSSPRLTRQGFPRHVRMTSWSTATEEESSAGALSPAEVADMHRAAVRQALIKAAGGEREAFRKMDLNRSGNISLQEFADSVSRMGVPWMELTGLRRPRDLFRLFDMDHDNVITFSELFPSFVVPKQRVSTPDFWNQWCRANPDPDNTQLRPKWQPSPEEGLQILFDASQSLEEVADKRKRMSATIRRLKARGKSDARCREVVALHLPRGTGPKDREDVQTFSAVEVRACKKSYADEVLEPVRNIQKVVFDMREQRRQLQVSRQKLWAVTMEPVMRRNDEDRAGLSSSAGLFAKPKDEEGEAPARSAMQEREAALASLAKACGMDVAEVREINEEYLRHADDQEIIHSSEFATLVRALCPSRSISDSEIAAWWRQLASSNRRSGMSASGGDQMSGGGKALGGAGCTFATFALWFATSEARDE